MKRSEDTTDPEVERELDALERALAGLPVDEEMAPIATLVADVREQRPEPEAEWAAELDRQVAGGFAGRPSGAGAALGEWIGSLRGRSMLAPVGALATLLIVVAVGVGVTQDGGSDDATTMDAGSADLTETTASPESGDAAVPVPGQTTEESPHATNLDTWKGAGQSSADTDVGATGAGAAADASGYRTSKSQAFSRESGSGTAPGQEKRQQDRSAYLQLKTDTSKVREVSDEAIQITESVGGVVLSSDLSEQRDHATASLELSIPTRELDSTLDRLTDLATVASLNEASVDITKPFVSAQDALKDAQAERKQLLQALAEADTETEADAIQAQLDDVREEISRAEAAFDNIARRARLSTVSLQIEGTPNGDDDGSWSIGDAADDAVDALGTVAGVMLVGAAIVVPILALIALIAWLTLALRKRSREKALDE